MDTIMATKVKKKNGGDEPEGKWPYGKKNYILFAAALIVIILGFVTLGQGSMTLAPILLVVGYCVLIPMALIVKDKPEETETTEPTPTE